MHGLLVGVEEHLVAVSRGAKGCLPEAGLDGGTAVVIVVVVGHSQPLLDQFSGLDDGGFVGGVADPDADLVALRERETNGGQRLCNVSHPTFGLIEMTAPLTTDPLPKLSPIRQSRISSQLLSNVCPL